MITFYLSNNNNKCQSLYHVNVVKLVILHKFNSTSEYGKLDGGHLVDLVVKSSPTRFSVVNLMFGVKLLKKF